MAYGDFGDFGWWENKANSKPNTGLWPETLSTKPETLNKDTG